MMMRYCERKAREGGFAGLEMGATLSGVALYERCGYIRSGKIDVVRQVLGGLGRKTCMLTTARCPNGEGIRIVHMLKDPPKVDIEAHGLARSESSGNDAESAGA